MNKLLEIKDKAVKFCGEYEHFILPVVRFAVAFIAFITIDLNIGYMAKISSMLVALLLALVCALLPVNAILWIASIMILLDMYALSIEVFAITFVLLLVLYFVYFRFAPKDGMLVRILAFTLSLISLSSSSFSGPGMLPMSTSRLSPFMTSEAFLPICSPDR